MLIDTQETLALAEMLWIKLTETDAQRLAGDMSSVLDYVKLLDEVDVSGVEAMGVGLGGYAELREDIPAASLPVEDLDTMSGGAFDPQQEMFTVKPIFS